MSDINSVPHAAASGRFYALLLCFFIGSGCAALVYEIVWFQLLELVIGSTAVSLAVLLGTFMGGMCLGSLAFARLVPTSLHPLKVYAAIEFGIGVIAVAVLYLLPAAADLYAGIGAQGAAGIAARAGALGIRGDLFDDRAFGLDRARRASCLDAAVVAAAGTVGLHVLDHSGGVSARARTWQQHRVSARARPAPSARDARLVPGFAHRR